MTDVKQLPFPALSMCSIGGLLSNAYFCFNGYDLHFQNCSSKSNTFKNKVKKYIGISHRPSSDAPYHCIQLNHEKRVLYLDDKETSIPIKGIRKMTLHIHEPDDFPASLIKGTYQDNSFYFPGQYSVKILQKATIKRLKSPYRSNCSDGTPELNVFPGPYTRDKCKRTCILNKMINKCGGVIDVWRKYLRPEHTKRIKNNTGHSKFMACLNDISFDYLDIMKLCYCPLPCHENMYKFTIERIHDPYFDERVAKFEHWFKYMNDKCKANQSNCWDKAFQEDFYLYGNKYRNADTHLNETEIMLKYQSFEETEITEIPAYPIEQSSQISEAG